MSEDILPKISTEQEAAGHVIEILKGLPAKVTIKTPVGYEHHMGLLKAAKARVKAVESFWEELIAPVRQQKKMLEDKRKKMLAPYDERVKLLSDACIQFFSRTQAKVEDRQAKENEKFDEKVQQMLAEGKDTSHLIGPKQIEGLAKTIGGVTVQMRTSWRLRFAPSLTQQSTVEIRRSMYAADQIPNEYWLLDRGKVWKDLQNGKEIPGIEAIKIPVTSG